MSKSSIIYGVLFGIAFLVANGVQCLLGATNGLNISGILVGAIVGGVAGPYLLEK